MRGGPWELSALGPCVLRKSTQVGESLSLIYKITVMLICKLLSSAGQDLGRKAYCVLRKSCNWPDWLIQHYPSRCYQVPKRADPRRAVETSSHKCLGTGVSQAKEILQTVTQRHKPQAHLQSWLMTMSLKFAPEAQVLPHLPLGEAVPLPWVLAPSTATQECWKE